MAPITLVTITTVELLMLIGIPAFSSFIFQLIFNKITGKFKKGRDDDATIKKGLQALLRDRLRSNYSCYKEQGSIDMADKENYDNLYQSYHTLGKNGVMDDMHEQIMDLPIKKNKY